MTNEEKILAILEKHGELLTQMQAAQAQMQEEISGLKAGQAQMQTKQDRMEENLHMVKAYLELDIEKRFDGVNLGIDLLERRLDTLDEVKALAEETRDKVDVVYAVVKEHSSEISKLKKAQ